MRTGKATRDTLSGGRKSRLWENQTVLEPWAIRTEYHFYVELLSDVSWLLLPCCCLFSCRPFLLVSFLSFLSALSHLITCRVCQSAVDHWRTSASASFRLIPFPSPQYSLCQLQQQFAVFYSFLFHQHNFKGLRFQTSASTNTDEDFKQWNVI